MPRARKTQTGAPAMSVQQVPGQQYGKGVEQAQLQRAMPAPQAASVPSPLPVSGPASPSVTPMPPATIPTAPPVDPMAAAAALRDRVGLLATETDRPLEPITTGLSSGPGQGPEALGLKIGSPLGDTLRRLARATGDQTWELLADRSRL